jgi:hypothetical protein
VATSGITGRPLVCTTTALAPAKLELVFHQYVTNRVRTGGRTDYDALNAPSSGPKVALAAFMQAYPCSLKPLLIASVVSGVIAAYPAFGQSARVPCVTTTDGRTVIEDYRTLPPWADKGWEVTAKQNPERLESGWTRYQCWIAPPSAAARACENAPLPRGVSGSYATRAFDDCMRRKGRPQ